MDWDAEEEAEVDANAGVDANARENAKMDSDAEEEAEVDAKAGVDADVSSEVDAGMVDVFRLRTSIRSGVRHSISNKGKD